jgi:hypothetical protein
MRIFIIYFCLTACSPSSLQDLSYEADSEMKKLTIELRGIETKEDLQNRSKKIKKRFSKIARLLIQTRSFLESTSEVSLVAEDLFVELARLYEIPGMREGIEDLQQEAVHLLHKKSRV